MHAHFRAFRVWAPGALVCFLMGCAQPHAAAVRDPLPRSDLDISSFRFCLVGTSNCSELSEQPFEPCLLAAERCPHDAQPQHTYIPAGRR